MLAKLTRKLPPGEGWQFEPKWDGFRVLVFRDGDKLYLQSRDSKPLLRYFPELNAPLLAQLPPACVLDGELVIVGEDGLDFNALQMRLHPAKSRIDMLSGEIPSSIVLWDLLALGEEDLRDRPLQDRRAALVQALSDVEPPVFVTPASADRAQAQDWFHRFEGAGFDGVIAKQLDGAYQPGKRGWIKVKHERTVDCVVAGFRWWKRGPGTHLGSLLLGLYDDNGVLHHVGVAGSFKEAQRKALVSKLAPYRDNALDGHPWAQWKEWESETRTPGAYSRWNADKDLSWEPVRPELVAEVRYDHLQGPRFRHTAYFRRWREDKPPAACTYDQCDVTPPIELELVFKKRRPGA